MASYKIGDHIKFFNDFNEICYAVIKDIDNQKYQYHYCVYKRADKPYQIWHHCSVVLLDSSASLIRHADMHPNNIWFKLNEF